MLDSLWCLVAMCLSDNGNGCSCGVASPSLGGIDRLGGRNPSSDISGGGTSLVRSGEEVNSTLLLGSLCFLSLPDLASDVLTLLEGLIGVEGFLVSLSVSTA